MKLLIELCIAAHEQALKDKELTPAERPEFMHLPMVRVNDIPVFDAHRMRNDQVDDVVARLEKIVRTDRATNVKERVLFYMQEKGRFGARLKDICSGVGATKPIVLRYLREMVDDGRVVIREVATRGPKASPRKMYCMNDGLDTGPEYEFDAGHELEGLVFQTDRQWGQNSNVGLIEHGTSVGGFQCGCRWCADALVDAMVAEERSAARKAGGSGFSAGLDIRRRRREAALLEDQRRYGP